MFDKGYGICTSLCSYKPNAIQLFKQVALDDDDILHSFTTYCYNYGFNPDDDSDEDAWKNFVEDYEDNVSARDCGFEGMIAHVINNAEFGGDDIFVANDNCLYVSAYVPVDDEDKAIAPTQKDIQRILAKYIGPLLEVPAEIMWVDVTV